MVHNEGIIKIISYTSEYNKYHNSVSVNDAAGYECRRIAACASRIINILINLMCGGRNTAAVRRLHEPVTATATRMRLNYIVLNNVSMRDFQHEYA